MGLISDVKIRRWTHAQGRHGKSYLFWPVGECFVIYRVLEDTIEIAAVTQGSRDISTYLRRRP